MDLWSSNMPKTRACGMLGSIFRQMARTHFMEDVIYCELFRRGHVIDIGLVDTVAKDAAGKSVRRTDEIDFAINSGFRRVYLKSVFNMSDDGRTNEELHSLRMTRRLLTEDSCHRRQ